MNVLSPAPDLAAIAASYRESLPDDADLTIFAIDPLDRTGIPVVQAACLQPGGASVIGYGYGVTAAEATVGALGELAEEVHVGRWIGTVSQVEASYDDLRRVRDADSVADPLTLCLPAGSEYAASTRLSWVAAHRWPDGEEVMVPLEWVAAYADQMDEPPVLITPITNGLGAGLNVEHAISHGLLELLQRDGNVTSYRALDQGCEIDIDNDDPEIAALIGHLQNLDIDVKVKLASTEFGLTNLYVVGDDRGAPTAPIQVTACGEAVHPERRVALRKALLEFCGSRARKAATHGPIPLLREVMPPAYFARQMACAEVEEDEERAVSAMAEWMTAKPDELRRLLSGNVFASRSHVTFSSLPDVAHSSVVDPAARLTLLTDRLAAEGLTILWVDCSPKDSPVRVVKVVVPGLECETMSYGRIGWRGVRRLRSRGDALLLDAPAPGALPVRLRAEDEARAGGPAWFDVAASRRIVGALYPLYREPGPFAAQLRLGSAEPAPS